MADFQDSKSLGAKELALYDALLKHWIDVNEPDSVDDEQIDDLFPNEPEPIPIPSISLVSWSTGTDEEISAMIDGYYNGDLTLEQIQSVWHVGDIRTVNLSRIQTTANNNGVNETHAQQDIELVILDFEHDNLTNNINNKTKALITVQTKDCLRGNSNVLELGQMDVSDNNFSWQRCGRRNWCNNTFYNALPSYLKNIIKEVDKISVYDNEMVTTSDKVFLISVAEGEIASSNDHYIEGYTYKYYETESNRYKQYGWNSTYFESKQNVWWTRTIDLSDSQYIEYFYASFGYSNDIQIGSRLPSTSNGIAPAFCL